MNDILKEPIGEIHPQIRCWKCHDFMKSYSKRGICYLKCRADCDKQSLSKRIKELEKEVEDLGNQVYEMGEERE